MWGWPKERVDTRRHCYRCDATGERPHTQLVAQSCVLTVDFSNLQIPFAAAKGPAFIWSLNFSTDDEWLAVGCWNGGTTVYRVQRGEFVDDEDEVDDAAAAAEAAAAAKLQAIMRGKKARQMAAAFLGVMGGVGAPSSEKPRRPSLNPRDRKWIAARDIARKAVAASETRLTKSATIQRTDRVYAVALDRTGRHLAIGGRDKRVVMFDLRPHESGFAAPGGKADSNTEHEQPEREGGPHLLWEVSCMCTGSNLAAFSLSVLNDCPSIPSRPQRTTLFTQLASRRLWSIAHLAAPHVCW